MVVPDAALRGLLAAGVIYSLMAFLWMGQLQINFKSDFSNKGPQRRGSILLESLGMGTIVALLFATGLTWAGQQGHYTDNFEERVMLGSLFWLGVRFLEDRYVSQD